MIASGRARLARSPLLLLLWLPLGGLAQDAVAPVDSRSNDPTAGINEDGSIPRRPMPPGLNAPERWRYVPEGRLVEGSILDRFMISTFAIPVFFYQEDLGLGMGLNLTDINFLDSRRRQLLNLAATYSTEGQQSYAAFWRWLPRHEEVQGGGVVFEERSLLAVGGGYKVTLTNRFFGFGPESDEDDESNYSDERSGLGVTFSNSFPRGGDPLIYSLAVLGEYRNLGQGHDSDSPSTDDVFPALFDEADGYAILWLKGGLRWDTLDSTANPYRGFALGVDADFAAAQTHGNSGAIFKVWGSGALKVPSPFHDGGSPEEENPPTDTIAVGLFLQTTAGELPFWALPNLGGANTLRGYVARRFTDRVAWHAVVEWRFWPIPRGIKFTDSFRIERLGMALFLEAGSVASRLDTLTLEDLPWSGGVSFRMALERTTLFRVDIGGSPEGAQVTIAYGLSF